MPTYNTIILAGDPIRKEATAGTAITPGHLCEFAADDALEVHGTAAGNAGPLVAVEENIRGAGVDDAYAIADIVQYVVMRPGDEAHMVLEAGNNFTKGDFLESAGDGTLQEHVPPVETSDTMVPTTLKMHAVLFMLMEDVNLSASGAADTRARVMAI